MRAGYRHQLAPFAKDHDGQDAGKGVQKHDDPEILEPRRVHKVGNIGVAGFYVNKVHPIDSRCKLGRNHEGREQRQDIEHVVDSGVHDGCEMTLKIIAERGKIFDFLDTACVGRTGSSE